MQKSELKKGFKS